ncbi:MAG: ATP-binding protein [Ornithinimicrobium sp.]|uniref:ATP-binding protein n=1 Tax=Ornithinimicrobium sp. TaxID=1977084 RepID=UPI003D9B4CB9
MLDGELAARLESSGAVLIEGPKACGKTETARQAAASMVYLDTDVGARQTLAIDPSLVLAGAAPRLLDEWQSESALWNHVRRAVDERRRPGQFILTGSAVPADDQTRHTGAARVSRLRMRPMSLFESGHSTGAISLRQLLDGESARSTESRLGLNDLTERATVGGWPGFQDRTPAGAAQGVRDYLEQVTRVDVGRVDGVRRDPDKVRALATALARNVATEVSVSTLASDVIGVSGLERSTVRDYLDALTRLMVLEDQPAWARHLRSKARLRQSAKRHFVDPSLAVAALRASPARLRADLNLFGLVFESMVIRDLRIYSQPREGEVQHYRDSNGLEVDAIIECADGRWAAFEVKLSPHSVDDGAASLLRFSSQVDTDKCGKPAALGVITGSGYGYRRPDGVHVIPIGALGP